LRERARWGQGWAHRGAGPAQFGGIRPCARLQLTERSIKALKPRTKPYKAADGEGLYIEVTPAGGKLWRLKNRFGGKEKRLSFDPWPDIGVDAAREKATAARAILRDGPDPARGHRAARGGMDGETMGALADKQSWAPSTEKRERYLLAQWTAKLGDIPPRVLTPADIRPVVPAIEAEGHGENARRALAQIGRVIRHAVALGHAERDVAADLGDVLGPVQSEKYATLTKPAEIAELMKAIFAYTGDPSTCYCLRILPLVFTRPGELRNATWAEFDLDVPEPLRRIPGGRMKMRGKNSGEHLVPLSTQAAGLLRELHTITGTNPRGLLFPGLVAGKPTSENTLNQALRRLGYGPDRIVPHGFRAVASTALNEQGHLPDLIELQLAHRDSSVRAVYNRSTRLPERRAMMQSWSDDLDALRTGANVVPFRRPAGAI
jgi:integrase